MDYSSRRARAAQLAQSLGLAGLVIAPGPQFRYLTGTDMHTHERLCVLVITPAGAPVVVAPAVDRGDAVALGLECLLWEDGQDPYALVLSTLGEKGPVAVSDSLTADHLLSLQGASNRSWSRATRVLAELFVAKEPGEIDYLRQAGAAIDRVHEQVPGLLGPGRTEAEVSSDLRELILAEHAAVDFVIVGSGPNGANPHHEFSDRVLEHGDIVVVDIGGTLGPGYHSDCTRTYRVGGPGEVPEFYQVLERAQQAARAVVRPGVRACEVDAAARDIIDAAGFGEFFIHRTGHGIGLSTHEEPFIMPGNELVLQAGMAFSIEPGIYLPGQYGARIEDIVVVTEAGYESLNNTTRKLV